MTRIRIDKGYDRFVEGRALGYVLRDVGGLQVLHVILALDSGDVVQEPMEQPRTDLTGAKPSMVRVNPLRRLLNWTMGMGAGV